MVACSGHTTLSLSQARALVCLCARARLSDCVEVEDAEEPRTFPSEAAECFLARNVKLIFDEGDLRTRGRESTCEMQCFKSEWWVKK